MFRTWFTWGRAACRLVLIGLALCLPACSRAEPTPVPLVTVPSFERLPTRTPTPTITPIPSPTPPTHYQDGLAALERGDFEAALVDFDRALADRPNPPSDPALATIYVDRARALRLTGHHDAALADVEIALALDGALTDAWLLKVALHQDVAEWEQALQALDRLLELQPDLAQAYLLRAEIREQVLGQSQEALSDYERAARLDPSLAQSLQAVRWRLLAELGRWEEAVLVSGNMFMSGNPDPLRYYYHGLALVQTGYVSLAISDLSQGIRRYPDYAGPLYYALGVAYVQQGSWDEAIRALDVALAQQGVEAQAPAWRDARVTASEILGWMGAAYLGLDACPTARDLLQRAVAGSEEPGEWDWALERLALCGLTPTPTITPTPIPAQTPTPVLPPTPVPTETPPAP